MHTVDPKIRRRIIAGCAVLIQLCLGTVYAWSIFKKPLMAECGWSEVQTQSVMMVYSIVISVAVAMGGTLTDRMGPRLIGLLGGILFGTGLVMAGISIRIGSQPLLLFSYGVVAGAGAGCSYVSPLTALIRWFPDKRGMVTGLAIMGYGLGSFLLGNIGPAFIIRHGAAMTFFAWGGFSFVVLLSMALLLSDPPSGWSPAACAASSKNAPSPKSAPFAVAVRTGRFWILWLIFLAGSTIGLGLISQLSPLVQEVVLRPAPASSAQRINEAAVLAGTVVALAGLFNAAGRLCWSWLSDHAGRKMVFGLIFSFLVLGLFSLPSIRSFALFSGICFLLLACYGGMMATMPALAADEFGPAFIGRIYGFLFIATGIGGVLGNYIFASIKERTGEFTNALYLVALLATIGLTLVGTLRRGRRGAVSP